MEKLETSMCIWKARNRKDGIRRQTTTTAFIVDVNSIVFVFIVALLLDFFNNEDTRLILLQSNVDLLLYRRHERANGKLSLIGSKSFKVAGQLKVLCSNALSCLPSLFTHANTKTDATFKQALRILETLICVVSFMLFVSSRRYCWSVSRVFM